jgi:hypothetical protein
MTDASAPSAETPFGQHARLAELVHALRFQRYALFVAGLVYEHADGGLQRATAVADREGNVLAWDAGEPFHLGGRVPASRLFDDEDLTGRSEGTLLRALADRNQEFFAHELAALPRAATASTRSPSASCGSGCGPSARPPRSCAPRSWGSSRSRSPTACWTPSGSSPTTPTAASWWSRSSRSSTPDRRRPGGTDTLADALTQHGRSYRVGVEEGAGSPRSRWPTPSSPYG